MKFLEKADFLSIDFETATPNMNSACSVGIAVVSNLDISEKFYSLIQPPGNQYSEEYIHIHGITPTDTERAEPAWVVLRHLIPYLNAGIPVVAHNANFDMSVLNQSIGDHANISDFKYIDTMDMVKSYGLSKRGLSDCVKHFGIELGCHHNALDDATACARIAIACIQASAFERFSDFCIYTPDVKIRQYSQLVPMVSMTQKSLSYRRANSVRPSDITPSTSKIDPNNPLYGKSIVFTGELSISRAQAAQMAVDSGAILKSGVSKQTDYLVVGLQDITLVGQDGMSSKEEKAHSLNSQGKANIHIISEQEFINLLQK